MPNNSWCPTSSCHYKEFTSLALCHACEEDVVQLDRNLQNCSYSIQKELWQTANFSHYPYLVTTYRNVSSETIRGPISTYDDFVTAAMETNEASIWSKTCQLPVGDYPPLQISFTAEPRRYALDTYGPAPLHRNRTSRQMGARELADLPLLLNMTLNLNPREPASLLEMIGNVSAKWETGRVSSRRPSPPIWEQGPSISGCFYNWIYEGEVVAPYTRWPLLNSTCVITSFNPETVEHLGTFGEMNTTLTKCHLRLCARQYRNVSVAAGGFKTANTKDWPLTVDRYPYDVGYTVIDNNNHTFQLDSVDELGGALSDTTKSASFKMLLHKYTPNSTSDWEQFFERVAHIYTETLQSPWNPNRTLVHGDAYASEIFVRVR